MNSLLTTRRQSHTKVSHCAFSVLIFVSHSVKILNSLSTITRGKYKSRGPKVIEIIEIISKNRKIIGSEMSDHLINFWLVYLRPHGPIYRP